MSSTDPTSAMAAMFQALVDPSCGRILEPEEDSARRCGKASVGWSDDDRTGLCAEHVADGDEPATRLDEAALRIVEAMRARVRPEIAIALARAMADAGQSLEMARSQAHTVGKDDAFVEVPSEQTVAVALDVGSRLLDMGAPMPRIAAGETGLIDLHWRGSICGELLLCVDAQARAKFYGEAHRDELRPTIKGELGEEWTVESLGLWLRSLPRMPT